MDIKSTAIMMCVSAFVKGNVIPRLRGRALRSCWIAVLLAGAGVSLGAETAPHTKKIIIVALGDSTTAGTPFARSPLEAPPEDRGDPQGQFSYWMMHWRPQWEVLNYGIAGQTTSQIRARFDDILKEGPRYIIILAGVNDVYQGLPLQSTADNLLWMYKEAQGHTLIPVAATVLPFDKATPTQAQTIDALNVWIKRAAEKMRIPIADTNAAVRNPADPHRLSDSTDGIHPDIGGYRKIGKKMIEAIDPIEKAWR